MQKGLQSKTYQFPNTLSKITSSHPKYKVYNPKYKMNEPKCKILQTVETQRTRANETRTNETS